MPTRKSEIREGGYYYVDKTPVIERLVNQNKFYFLSRPWRFGKSLLLDTLRCLFEGRQSLFEFKVVEQLPEGKALEQIKHKGYADKYHASGKPIHLIGVEFSRVERQIVAFDVEDVL